MSSHHDTIKKLAERLEDWDYKLDRLEHRILGLPNELKAEAKAKIERLKAYQIKLREREQAVVESATRAANEIEESVEETLGAMKLLFEEIELDVDVEVS